MKLGKLRITSLWVVIYHMLRYSHLVHRLHHSRLAGTVRNLPVRHIEDSHSLALVLYIAGIDHSRHIADTVDQVGTAVRLAGMSWH